MVNKNKKTIFNLISVVVCLFTIPIFLSSRGMEKDLSDAEKIKIFYVKDNKGQHFIFSLEDDVYSISKKTKEIKDVDISTNISRGLKETRVELHGGNNAWIKFSIKKQGEQQYSSKFEYKRKGIKAGKFPEQTRVDVSKVVEAITGKIGFVVEENFNDVDRERGRLWLKYSDPDKSFKIEVEQGADDENTGKWVVENGDKLREDLHNYLDNCFNTPPKNVPETEIEEPLIELVQYPGEDGMRDDAKISSIQYNIEDGKYKTFQGWKKVFDPQYYIFEKSERKEVVLNKLIRSKAVLGSLGSFLKNYLSRVKPTLFFIAAVTIIALIMFVFPWLLYTKIIEKNNREIRESLQAVEENFFRFEAPAAALKRIPGIIGSIKKKIEGKSFRLVRNIIKKRAGVAKDNLIKELDTFDKKTMSMSDFVENHNTKFSDEIVKLHSGVLELRKETMHAIGGDRRQYFFGRIDDILSFLEKEYPDLIKEKQGSQPRGNEEWLDKPFNLSEVSNKFEKLMDEIPEECSNKSQYKKIMEKLEFLKESADKLHDIEVVHAFDLESELDKFSYEFSQFDLTINQSFENNTLPLYLRADIKGDLIKIRKIIDFIRSDYNKYKRITVRLEEIKNKFSNVLGSQNKLLGEKNTEMEKMISGLEKLTQSTVDTFKGELNKTLEDQEDSFNIRKDQLTGIINTLSTSTTSTINQFEEKFNNSLETQTEAYNNKKNEMESIIFNLDTSTNDAVKRFEDKFNQLSNNHAEIFNRRKDELSDIINHLNTLTSSTIKLFEDKFDQSLEKQSKIFDTTKEELSGIIDTFNTTVACSVDQFKEKFNQSVENQTKTLDIKANELSSIITGLDKSTTSTVNAFKEELYKTLNTQKHEFGTFNENLSHTLETRGANFEAKGNEIVKSAADEFENLRSEFTRIVEEQIQKLDSIGEAIVPHVKERFESFVETMSKNFDYGEINERYVDFLNKKMHLNISKENGPTVIERIVGEPKISEDYRTYAINLFKLLLKLEKTYKDEWYWPLLLGPLKEKLDLSVLYFLNREGKTIYDSSFNNDEKWVNLKNVNEQRLRHLINQEHWGQIWEPLFRWAEFFNVYFKEHLDDISIKLQSLAIDVRELFENSLGYKIEIYRPMQIIAKELIEVSEVQEISEHFTFFPKILPKIKNTESLAGAANAYSLNPDKKIILYVDQLGLIDNGNRIRKPKLIFYSPHTIKHYE